MTVDSPASVTTRPLLAAAVVAAVTFVAQIVVQAVTPPQSAPFARPSDYAIEALFLAGLLAVTVATVLLHRWHTGSRWGRLGAIASGVSAAGSALLAVVVGATLVTGGSEPEIVGNLFLPGLAAWAIGGILLAVAAFRAGRLPRPVAVLLGAAIPLSTALGDPFGPVTVAVLWAAVALAVPRT